MSNFSSLVITNAGKELVAKLQANKERVTFTSVKTSNQKFEVDKLTAVDNFVGIQSRGIETLEYTDPNRVKIITNFNNVDVVAGYNVNSIGIFAKLDKTTEILYAVATVKEGVGDWMSANGSQNQVSMRFSALLTVSDLEVESVAIIEAGYVLEADFLIHVQETAKENVHGAIYRADGDTIMARNTEGMAQARYIENRATDNTVINKAKLTKDVNDLEKKITEAYTQKDSELETAYLNKIGQLQLNLNKLQSTAVIRGNALTIYNPDVEYDLGDTVVVIEYDGMGGGLNLIAWSELKGNNYNMELLYPLWKDVPAFFVVKSNKGEYTWTVQDTLNQLKPYFTDHLTEAEEFLSVYDVLTLLLKKAEVLQALDITGEFGKVECILKNVSQYKWGGELD